MNNNEIVNLIYEKELEIKKLKIEIEDLKDKLNKPIINDTELSLTREEKVKVFMNYFRGRDDVYPYLSIDRNNHNIKYYIPACANEWKQGVCNKTMGKKHENHYECFNGAFVDGFENNKIALELGYCVNAISSIIRGERVE